MQITTAPLSGSTEETLINDLKALDLMISTFEKALPPRGTTRHPDHVIRARRNSAIGKGLHELKETRRSLTALLLQLQAEQSQPTSLQHPEG